MIDSAKKNPDLSVVVIAHSMSRQAINTAYSLSVAHQKNVGADEYEIIVIENSSTDNIPTRAIESLGTNIRHIQRHETSQSPAKAINIGLDACRGQFVGLMIDGARMVTPRVIEYALLALRAQANSLIAVPSYNLGPAQHHRHKSLGYGESREIALLESARWQENGYRLFDISSIGDAISNGLLTPPLESNCFFTSLENFKFIGGANEEFHLPGGGSLNLHMFRSIGILPGITYFVMAGEGTFHQFHGGITTQETEDRDAVLESHKTQLNSYWPGGFRSLSKEPILLGSISSHALRYLRYSGRRASKRAMRRINSKLPLWPDDQ